MYQMDAEPNDFVVTTNQNNICTVLKNLVKQIGIHSEISGTFVADISG